MIMSTTTTTTTTTNHHHHHKFNIPLPSSRTTTTTQACASCRYQRRKCAPDCLLAPYFPHDRQRQFQNAHKLFGVRNITKIIGNLDQPHRDEAMRTIIFQSDARAQDPVGGCYHIIRDLQRQIDYSRAELEIVLHQLAICRAQAAGLQQNHLLINGSSGVDPLGLTYQVDQDQVVLDYASNITNQQDHDHPDHHPHHNNNIDDDQITQDQYINLQGNHHDHQGHDHNHQGVHVNVNLNEVVVDDHVVPLHEINPWAAMHDHSALLLSGPLEIKQNSPSTPNCVDDCEDFKRLMINDINIPPECSEGDDQRHLHHQFKFEFEDINEPSSEETITMFNEESEKAMMKEENVPFQHNQDHDLKGAATLFTLTY